MPALFLSVALLAGPLRIAVLDVRGHQGVAETLAQGVTDDTILEVRRIAKDAKVIGADEIRTMLSVERQKQLLGCSSGSCLAEIGGALGAGQIISGTLNRFGATYLLDLKLLDARANQVIHEASARFGGEAEVLDAVAASVHQLFPEAAPVPGASSDATAPGIWEEPPEVSPTSSHSHWASILLGASGLVCGGIAIAGVVDVLGYQSARQSNGQLTYAQAQSGSGTAQTWAVASTLLGIAAVGLATTAVITW